MNDTFNNLPEEKRQKFIRTSMKEFAQNNYESASINRIVKALGIARGSVYQYFEDKLDLWLFLKEHAESRKIEYLQAVDRSEYEDFWTYYKELYLRGLVFTLEEPYCSKLLNRIAFMENSPAVSGYTDDWKNKAEVMLNQMVEQEKRTGFISSAVKTELATAFLISIGRSISSVFRENNARMMDAAQGNSVISPDFQEKYAEVIDDFINLAKKALQ